MTVHELRIFELTKGSTSADFIQFFHRDDKTDLRAALRGQGITVPGAWRTVGRPAGAPEEIVWIRAFKNVENQAASIEKLYNSKLWLDKLKGEADRIVEKVEAIHMTPIQAAELAKGPRDRGFHELRHYRLANNALPKMLAFFEDVRRFVGGRGVRVLAWWCAELQDSERFLWLREFKDAETKVKLSKEIYESELWLSKFKPRTVGVIEERILRDLEPIPAAAMGGYDPIES